MGPSGARGASSRRDNEYSGGQHFWVGFPQGHGMTGALMPDNTDYVSTYQHHPIVDEYFRHCFHERKRRLGERARNMPLVGTIFPKRLVSRPPAARHLRLASALAHGNGGLAVLPGRCRCARRGKGCAAPLLHALFRPRRYDRAGRHGELALCHGRVGGTIARRYPFNYQMSMGAYKTNDPIPGDVSLQITDQTPRNYYRVYAQYLDGAPWDALIGRTSMRAAAE